MYVLGIETSCDETALAILDCNQGKSPTVLAEEISSQSEIHEAYGGVVPELASREHLSNLPLLLDKVLKDSNLSLSDLSLICVTQGPGLKGCLLMGLGFAKGINQALGIPLVGVNHIEGHVFAPVLDNAECKPPFLSLVVSGGHTEILQVNAVGDYKVLSRTIDDAAGEAFDKSANLLGLQYPGGPRLAALADQVTSSQFKLPRIMTTSDDFSFSGLKTAISLLISKNSEALKNDSNVASAVAFSIQQAIVDELITKLKSAIKRTGLKTVTVTGGVSANLRLRREVGELKGVKVYFPEQKHCMDNGAMIAFAGWQRFLKGERLSLEASVFNRWPLETLAD